METESKIPPHLRKIVEEIRKKFEALGSPKDGIVR